MRCDEVYLDDVAEEQGNLFRIVVEYNYDLLRFMQNYATTKMRRFIDTGSAWHCTRFGHEIFEWLGENGFVFKPCAQPQSPFVAEWLGVFYAYAQWEADVSFEELINRLSPMEIDSPLHDLDVRDAVKRVLQSELYKQAM